ncbi:MAG: hypothetical protein IKL40_00490, partial [Clostridia bacterium]|nr:hypothetical protein [Clostridia bacterium]
MLRKISLMLITVALLVSLCTSLATPALAAEAQAEAKEVYYSDLFYGYDTSYLSESTILKSHAKDTSVILANIYNEYASSFQGFWTSFKTGLNMSVDAMFKLDFREYAELMSDTYGDTDYVYTNALDSANLAFAKNILRPQRGVIENHAANFFGGAQKLAKKAKSLLKLYDTFENNFEIEKLTDYEIFYEMFEYVKGEGIFYFVGNANITLVEEVVLKDVSKYVDMVDSAADALEAVQTIMIGIMLEDVRMEIIDEILDFAPTDSCIHDGMTRLKSQLSGGFLTYFAENYFKDYAMGKLLETVTKPLRETLREQYVSYAIVGDAMTVASWVVFDVIFDVPDLGEMTTQKVLAS